MEAQLQRRVQRYGWDRAASLYESYWKQQLQPAQSKTLELAALKSGEHVLDVACGTGLITIPAAVAVGHDGRVYASDISDKMVDETRRAARDRGLTNVECTRMEAEELGYEDASVDVVLCSLGLMYVTDPDATLAEFFRVLKPGGRAVSAVWGERRNCGWADIFPIVESRVHSDVCPMFFQLGTGRTLAMTYELAGFRDIVERRIKTTLHYPNGEDACAAAFAGGPVAMAFSRFDERTRRESFDDYLASISEFESGAGYDIPGEFVVVCGVRPAA